ncbi:toll-like receptor 7 [Oppia nitens]|uniref:toll-like receptor 7 n=1 Tax=Oppia nitens TaxID=1686743 RepID=UPI0023DB418A|nr:toll-like receptor 7 [Oppia nitens]
MKLFIALLSLSSISGLLGSQCPKAATIAPCVCLSESTDGTNRVVCDGKDNINLKKIFADMSAELVSKDKLFHWFQLTNTAITELTDSVFADIKFQFITIEGASALKLIHTNAFAGQQTTIQTLSIVKTPLADSEDPNYNVFKAINSLTGLKYLTLWSTNLTKIPDQALTKTTLLSQISLQQNKIQTIGSQAFANFRHLLSLDLSYNNINHVSDNAFVINKNYYETQLDLNLGYNHLDDKSLSPQAFAGLKTTIKLSLNNRSVKVLPESQFAPILRADKGNEIIQTVDCQNCDNYWLERDFPFQVLNMYCTNYHRLNDTREFIKCH